MFDWFAARPPQVGQPSLDQPSIPLTDDERHVFDALSRQLPLRPGVPARLARLRRSGGASLVVGALLVFAGGAWIIAWLPVSVVVAFGGVVVQAVGFATAVEAQVRLRRDGSVAPLEASPPRHDAPRRPGR